MVEGCCEAGEAAAGTPWRRGTEVGAIQYLRKTKGRRAFSVVSGNQKLRRKTMMRSSHKNTEQQTEKAYKRRENAETRAEARDPNRR